MQKIISQFIDLMSQHGFGPRDFSDIVADDQRHRISATNDKPWDKTLVYQLKIDGDFGFGWFRSWKQGETVNFVSKSSRRATPEEKADYTRKAEEAKLVAAARIIARERRQRKAAGRIKRALIRFPFVETHPYLEVKKVRAHGLRLRRGELIIPAYQEDGLPWSVQRITAKGAKWFLASGKVEGGYYPLPDRGQPRDVIIVTEGFATAATVYEVTGYTTVCAFNAGNLEKVAQAIRRKYPDSLIVVAADNDRFTQIGNTGIIKGEKAAFSVKGFVVYPEFPESDQAGTDWNDYVNTHGEQQLREKLQRVTSAGLAGGDGSGEVVLSAPSAPTVSEPEPDWRGDLICDGKGNTVKNSLQNVILFLSNHPYYQGMLRLNDFQKDIFIARCPAWEPENEFRVRRLEDTDITKIAASLERFGITSDRNRVKPAIEVAAENDKFHPAKEYFDGLVWDGRARLDNWLAYYLGAEEDAPEYLAFIGKKWLTAAVKRIYEPGCKFDHVLVMEGKQGKGKSTALRYMATFGDTEESHFTDNIRITDLSNKDTIMMLQGSIIVELAELAGFSKKDDDEIKGWITLQQDRCRKPYGHMVTVYPRQFVLSATTNSYDYLKDPTGNRRYWPFKSAAVDLEAIVRDRRQLWAEAVHWYKTGLYIGPTEDEMELASAAQAKRLDRDVWEDGVLAAAGDPELYAFGFTTSDVMDKMGLRVQEKGLREARRVANILRMNGYEYTVAKTDGRSKKVWRKQ